MLGDFYRIIEAASGEEGLSLIEHCNGKIELVLLDLMMPGVDGLGVLRHRPQMPAFKEKVLQLLQSS